VLAPFWERGHLVSVAGLYEATGRAAVRPSVLAPVTQFRFLEDLSDREAAGAVAVRPDGRYALHLPLGYRGFDFSCRGYCRRRLVEHEQERPVFEAVPGRVRASVSADAARAERAVPAAFRTTCLERRSADCPPATERRAAPERAGREASGCSAAGGTGRSMPPS
jgi:hypothetical protein